MASARRFWFGGQAFASTLLNATGQLAHRLLGDFKAAPAEREASATFSAVRISARLRSRSSHKLRATCTASSARSNRPFSMAWRTNSSCSGVSRTSIRSSLGASKVSVKHDIRVPEARRASAEPRELSLPEPQRGRLSQRFPRPGNSILGATILIWPPPDIPGVRLELTWRWELARNRRDGASLLSRPG